MKQVWLLVSFATLFYLAIIQAKVISKNGDPINDNKVCKTCRELANNFLEKRRAGATKQDMYSIFKDLCVKYMIVAEDYCVGVINQELDTALYIIDNRPDLTAARICALYLQYKECVDPKLGNWTINIPEKQNIKKHNIRYETNKTHLKVLQLTDMHFDTKYKTGSNSKCSKNLCCRENSGKPATPEDAAGYWGSYGLCDIPWHTVQETLNHIKKEHKDIDFVYFTGDIISHTGYETSIEKNTNDIKQLFEALKGTFGTTPVYPVLGNHEPHPPDFYSPQNVSANFSTEWLYKLAVNEWSSWIPLNTSLTLNKGGFYTFLLKPGYRLIAMNNNVGYLSNLWIIFNDNDPFGELQWLVDTLYESEKNGEYVHLIGHIEPGDNLVYRFWMHQFHRILRRFSKTIKAQINGHSHMDEFKVVYDEHNLEEVVHYAFVSGSVTTFVGYNPMYRIYKISPETFEVMDYVQYTFNLTQANLTPIQPPKWYKQYTFLKEYGINKISAKTMGDLVQKLKTNKSLAYTYFKNQIRYSDLYLKQGCDTKCLQQKICRMTSIEFEDAIRCFD